MEDRGYIDRNAIRRNDKIDLESDRREEVIASYELLINLHYGNIVAELSASGHPLDKEYVDLERVEIKRLETLVKRCSAPDT
jgi:hypothetical protein